MICLFFKFPKLKFLETSIYYFFSFLLQKFKKLNISLIYKEIIVSPPMVNIYKFCKKEVLIQPPGDPREQQLGDVRPLIFSVNLPVIFIYKFCKEENPTPPSGEPRG